MITLHKLVPPENLTLFNRHPDLNKIWEVPVLQDHARDSYERWGVDPEESDGEIFSVDEEGQPVGIIGWYEYGEFPDVLRLRYYGIVPSRRGKRYGEEAMKLFLKHLSLHAPVQYKFLAESVSLNREQVAVQTIAHFEKLGFQKFDDPHYGSNAGCGQVQSLKIRIPGR
jgi:RimJ/RimL family protein N-acetyltransferase